MDMGWVGDKLRWITRSSVRGTMRLLTVFDSASLQISIREYSKPLKLLEVSQKTLPSQTLA